MRPRPALLAAGIALATGPFAPTGAARPDAGANAAQTTSTVLGLVRARETATPELARLDPATLRPLPGRRVRVPDHVVPSFSPDGTRVVFGNASVGSLTFVDVRRMRGNGYSWIGPDGPVVATAWPAPRRVLAAIARHRFTHATSLCCARVTIVVIDPVTRRTLRRVRLAADLVAVTRWRGLILLLAPVGRIGTARLGVADSTGRIRTVALERVRAGRNEDVRRLPGLAVDRAAGRAFVVGAQEPVAEVDLRTLAVTYHELDRSLAVRTKGIGAGPARRAEWLGGGLLAVSGEDWVATSFRAEPAGLIVVDTRTWRTRTIDAGIMSFWFAAGTLLAGQPLTSPAARADRLGLVGWGLDGRERLRLFPGRDVDRLETVGERAFVAFSEPDGSRRRYSVVDLRSGRPAGEFPGELPEVVR